MANNSSFAQVGATPKQSMVPKIPGVLTPNQSMVPKSTGYGNQSLFSNTPQMGTIKGVLAPPKINLGGKETVMKGSPSVMKQQQELNKLGAGLVVDGFAGDKTKEAIAKYGTGATDTTKKDTPPLPTPPPPLTVSGQAPGVLAASQPTDLETQKQNELYQAGQMTPQEERANAEVAAANALQKSYQNVGTLAPYAEAGMYSDRARTPEEIQALQRAPDLAGRASSTYGLTNALSNIYGSSRVAGANAALQGIQTAAQRGLGAAGTGLGAAQTTAQRGLAGATSVLGAVAPQFPSYSQQVIQPGLLGTSGQQGGGTIDSAVADVVEKLKAGTMTYNDAAAALSGYGQGGIDRLQKALPAGFNIAQSNTMAGQQGSVNVNYELADKALTNVETLMKELTKPQQSNVPIIAKGANWVSTQFGIGSEQTRAVTGAVQSLRNAYASLLASAKGGTPTDYSGQAAAEIPDQPTPNDIAAVRKNFETLGKARKDILGNPGQSGSAGGDSASAGGYNFKLVDGKWVAV